MNEEIDESEFYHQDFTTASEWEVFIARMEEIINQWRSEDMRNEKTIETNVWDIKSENLSFADTDFHLHSYKIVRQVPENEKIQKQDTTNDTPINMYYDFETSSAGNHHEHSCLSTWYGLNEYIVLSPANNIDIVSENKIKILLSSAYIVANSTNCQLPIFVQIREKWQKCYLGVYENESIRTDFEMVHLARTPYQCLNVTGLLEVFKSKISSPCSIGYSLVSLRSTYELTRFGNFIWKQELPNGDFDTESLFILPFGVPVDPISSLKLRITWNSRSELYSRESTFHSNFDPMNATKWSCSATKTSEEPLCLLGEVLSEFIHSLDNNSRVYDVLGDFINVPSLDSNPLDVLTEPAVPAITALLNRVARNSLTKNKRVNPPINESVLVPMLYFLFPDADENSAYLYDVGEEKESSENSESKISDDFKGFKTAPVGSLSWRLSIILAHALQSFGGVKAFCHIWYEFVQEMRYRWENSLTIPGLAPGVPDLRTCLLNQKLQMLNCCIERKLSRENSRQSFYDSAEDSETDDEFFDCSEKVPVEEAKKKEKHQPMGRQSKFGNSKLLKSGDPLYVPVTQEPVLKTEDQLEMDNDVLLKLGSDAEASELRARIMSASLLSDMESFKAANPGSVLEDFIRWYSPRDWIEEEEVDEWGQKKGHLSPRMLIGENNIWLQMWQDSKPVPACRQKRLFDDTTEAEKVLQFLACRTVAQVCDLTIPVLSHAAIYRLVEESRLVPAELPDRATRTASLLIHGERLSRDPLPQPMRFDTLVQELASLELLVSQANSLAYKLNPTGIRDGAVGRLIGGLVSGKETEIEGRQKSVAGGRMAEMFAEVQEVDVKEKSATDRRAFDRVLPAPVERETVLRVMAERPACHSVKCPQFLRAVVDKSGIRMAGAFSQDIVFF